MLDGFMLSKLAVQFPVRVRVPRQHHQPAGVFIQSMHHPKPAQKWLQYAPQMGQGRVVTIRN